MEIKHANIFYVRNIHAIGGVETYVYELAKKYQDYDIAVVCKTVAPEQKKRLKKFCKVYVHKNEPIECNVIITNWDTSILDYVNSDAKKYTVLHTDYSNIQERAGLPKDRPDITYIGITEISKKNFEDITGIKRTILCRNPLEVEEDEPILTLVSATRLTKIKDDGRMLHLANALQEKGINFIWYVLTTNEYKNNALWTNKNVVYVPNRLDVGSFMSKADWYVQLSSCEGDSYSLKESLYRGVPIVVCELPYFKEIGIENNKNALFYNIDNSNALEIAERMKQPLKFKFNKIEDGYKDILVESKSWYEEVKNMKKEVECIKGYKDLELNKMVVVGEVFTVEADRADYLEEHGAVKILKEIPSQDELVEKLKNKKVTPKAPKEKIEKTTEKKSKKAIAKKE